MKLNTEEEEVPGALDFFSFIWEDTTDHPAVRGLLYFAVIGLVITLFYIPFIPMINISKIHLYGIGAILFCLLVFVHW